MPDLTSAIELQLQQLELLKTNLESELHLISSRDAEALINVVQEKETLLEAIQLQDSVINGLYQPDTASEQQRALLEQGKELVKQCQYRTQINQTAVEQGQLRLEHLRNLLLEARAKESMTYDKSGKPQGGTHTPAIKA